mgnify:CR=1 FL=1
MSIRNSKKIAELSARIFGELMVPKNSANGHLIQRMSMKPIYKMSEYSMDYYPRQQEHDHLFKVLRLYGLYRLVHILFIFLLLLFLF